MKTQLATYIFSSFVLLISGTMASSGAPPSPAEVLAAAKRMDTLERTHYRVCVTETTNGSTRVYQVDTGASELESQARLISVDGNSPSEEQRMDFANERAKIREVEAVKTPEQKALDGIANMITPDSLRLAGETEHGFLYQFRPFLQGLEKASDKLEGTLICDLSSGKIRTMEIRNTGPFKPDMKVKIREFLLAFQFSDIPGFAEPTPTRIENAIKGTALWVASLDERATIEFADFEILPNPGTNLNTK